MPVIQRYSSQVNVPQGGTVRSRLASASDFGSESGAGLAQLGGTVSQLGEEIHRQFERRDAVTIQRSLVEADLRFTEQFNEDMQNAEPGAPGFVDATRDRINKLRDRMGQHFSGVSEANRLSLELGLSRIHKRNLQSAIAFQAKSSARKMRSDLSESTSTLINLTRAHPERYEEYIAQGADMHQAAMMGGLDKQLGSELKNNFVNALTEARFAGMLDKADTPQEVVALRGELEKFADRLDPATFGALTNAFEKAEDQLQRKITSEFTSRYKDTVRLYGSGESDLTDAVTHGEIDAHISDPVARRKMHEGLDHATQLAVIHERVDTASPAEILEMVQAFDNQQPRSMQETMEMNEKLSTLMGAINARNKAIEKDRVGYVLKNFEIANRAAQAYSENPNPATQQEYVHSVIAAQTQLGIPPGEHRLLSADGVRAFQQSVDPAFSDDENFPRQRAQFIAEQQDAWGKHWPMVHRQLVREKAMTPVVGVAAGIPDRNVAVKLLEVADFKDDQWETIVPDYKTLKKDAPGWALDALSDLSATVLPEQQSMESMVNHSKAVQQLGLYYMSQGESSGEAFRRAAEEIVLGNYEIFDTVRVPKQAIMDGGLSTTTLRRNLNAMVRDKDFMSNFIARSVTPGMTQEDANIALQDSLRISSRWVTNPEETGAFLIDASGETVMREMDGIVAPVELSWQEIQSYTPPREAETAPGQVSQRVTGRDTGAPQVAGISRFGRTVFRGSDGELFSEKSVTVKLGDKWYSVPSIIQFPGQRTFIELKTDQEVKDWYTRRGITDPFTRQEFPGFKMKRDATAAARERSRAIDEDLLRRGVLQ